MKNTEIRKQYSVPQTYLKHFALPKGDDYYVHIFHKGNITNQVEEKNISDICAGKHPSTLAGNGRTKQKLDDIYTDIFENQYNNLVLALTDDHVLEITDEFKKLVVSAVLTLFYKTKKWSDILGFHSSEDIEKIGRLRYQPRVDHYFNSNGMQVGFETTLEASQLSHKNIDRVPQIIAQLKIALKQIETQQFDFINIYKIVDESEFITSDNPVLSINIHKMRTIHFDTGNAYYLPITKKHLVAIFPVNKIPSGNKIIRLMINREWVDSFNSLQLFHSDKCIIGSIDALQITADI